MKKQDIYNIVKNHLLKYGADEIADTIDIDEENVLQVVNKIATNISNEISERESNTEQTNETDSKALHIADVSGCFSVDIDFGGNVKARIKICDDKVIVTDSMNGYGDAIPPENIDIVYLK